MKSGMRCLINTRWYTVCQINTANKTVIVSDDGGREHLYDLDEVAVWSEDVSPDNNANDLNISFG